MAYAVIGGFTTIFSLISLFVKEKLYIGEATVATIFGVIVGPHCLNWFSPTTWGNTDNITLEISRVVLVVQIFAVAVELPKKYMLKHWLSVFLLLVPVMTFGWLISSLFIWKLVPSLNWIESLVIAACITATDPVLASAVVGKGKFARRVPGHLRNLLSAESGCNDGMAFPFAYLALLCIQYAGHPQDIAFHFIVITVLYECLFGTILGAIIGYCGRHAIKFAEKKNLIDRESFLVFYFVLALFCTGVGSIIGTDDLLVAFAAGAAFSWDGWFARKTEESHVSNVIDLLLNMAFFVYFGAIVPWDQFNEASLGISPWKLAILAILIILFRRLPIMLALKPVIPDIRTWREALFCGHFGPIGVGAIFISILARAELEHDEPTPLAELPKAGHPNFVVVACIWPVVTFLIIASILVHGSSIAVFTLGKRLNNLTITMSYTTNGDQSQSWLSRLPRMDSARTSFSFNKNDASHNDLTDNEDGDTLSIRPATSSKPVKPGVGMTRRKRASRLQSSESEPARVPQNIPIDLNADRRAERERLEEEQKIVEGEGFDEKYGPDGSRSTSSGSPPGEMNHKVHDDLKGLQAYQEGSNIVLEDKYGEVVECVNVDSRTRRPSHFSTRPEAVSSPRDSAEHQHRRRVLEPVDSHGTPGDRRVMAYRLDDDIIVENMDGEVIRRYRIAPHGEVSETNLQVTSNPLGRRNSIIDKTLSLVGFKRRDSNAQGAAFDDVERQADDSDFVSVHTSSVSPDARKFDDERMKHRLKKLLDVGEKGKASSMPRPVGGQASQPKKAISPQVSPTSRTTTLATTVKPIKKASSPPPPVREPSLDDEDDEDSYEGRRDYDDEDEEETEIEKKRRLAALGLIDEEDDDAAFLEPRERAVQAAEKPRAGVPSK